jgi:hypothetical protein
MANCKLTTSSVSILVAHNFLRRTLSKKVVITIASVNGVNTFTFVASALDLEMLIAKIPAYFNYTIES